MTIANAPELTRVGLKEAKMQNTIADIEYCQNNGTLAIFPTTNGRLQEFVKQTKAGVYRVWSFADTPSFKNDDGDECVDHIMRGVLNGSYAAGREFLAACERLGFRVQSGNCFVPFSNGRRCCGSVHYGNVERPISDFMASELVIARDDLPSLELLAQMAEQDE
ncbi:MAG: hypothetical protein WCJ29_04405 [bacterium]